MYSAFLKKQKFLSKMFALCLLFMKISLTSFPNGVKMSISLTNVVVFLVGYSTVTCWSVNGGRMGKVCPKTFCLLGRHFSIVSEDAVSQGVFVSWH